VTAYIPNEVYIIDSCIKLFLTTVSAAEVEVTAIPLQKIAHYMSLGTTHSFVI